MATPDVRRVAESILERIQDLQATEWMPVPRIATIELLAVGTYHANFLVRSSDRRFVARYNRSSQWGLSQASQLTREFSVLRDLTPSSATPIPFRLETDTAHPFLLESFVDGKKFDYEDDLESCAIAIANSHRCTPSASAALLPQIEPTKFLLDDGRDWIKRVSARPGMEAAATLLAEAERLLRAQRVSVDAPPVILHTDLIQPNILQTSSGCALIDWEGARLGPRAWDLAYFLSPVTLRWADPPASIGDERRRAFLRVYADAAGLGVEQLEDEVNLIAPYVIFRALAWCAGYAAAESDIPPRARETLTDICSSPFIENELLGRIG